MKTYYGEADPVGVGDVQTIPESGPKLGDYADNTPWSKRARDVLSVKFRFQSPDVKWAGSRALVLQCESGLLADGLVRRGCEVTATDSRAYMVELAKTRSLSNGYLVHYRHVSDLSSLPFADDSFDIVVCDHLFDRSRNRVPALTEAARVLGSEGALLFSAVNPSLRSSLYARFMRTLLMPGLPQTVDPMCPIRPAALKRLLKSTGFKPGRMGGLRLKPASVLDRPAYRVGQLKPTIYLGIATRL